MHKPRHLPSLTTATTVCALAIALYGGLRLFLYPDRLLPLTYALPLLLGLWHRNRRLHYGMLVAFVLLAATEVFFIKEAADDSLPPIVLYAMMLINIIVVGVVTDLLIASQDRLNLSNLRLLEANAELEASNEELAAREEEIGSQNEELQRQTEELEQQMEELQQQSEELQQQSEELQQVHDETMTRERVLRALLEVSASLVSGGALEIAAHRVCEAALVAFGHDVSAAIVVSRRDGVPTARGYSGFSRTEQERLEGSVFDDPFILTVMDEGRPAAIEDLRQTPDVVVPHGPAGEHFRSVLAAPVRSDGAENGVLAVYSYQVRAWSEADFKIVEWLSAQATLVLLSARLQAELNQRARQAEESSRRKTRFLAAVSHDVRTPANAICLLAEVIKQTSENSSLWHEVPQMADTLRLNARLLVELVSDVLDLSRFDAGKIDVQASEFCLQDAIDAEVTQYQTVAKAAGLQLVPTLDPTPIWLRTDRMKLARVMGNLIGNAIKFTDTGAVSVHCARTLDGLVEIQVQDTGVGIPQDHLEDIFDEFYQINNPERDRNKGTGLGLAICKRLIDAIGCSLSVHSHVGQGSTFTVRIPPELIVVSREDAKLARIPNDSSPQERLNGVRVLVVEDHETTRLAVASLLTAQGADVAQAADGRAALHMLNHHQPEVVLLDLMLPDMDGREILHHLRSSRPANLRCLMAVSGDVTDLRQRELELLGVDALIAKPVQIDILTQRIIEHLQRAESTRQNAE